MVVIRGIYMIKKIRKLGVVLSISIILECLVFNFNYVKSIFDTSKEYNIKITLNELDKINWKEKDGILITEKDPQLIIYSIDRYIDRVLITYSSNEKLTSSIIFYTNKEITEINDELLIVNSEMEPSGTTFKVKDYVGIMRIDLTELPGIEFQDIQVILNPVNFQFSISRLVAMLLIYLFSRGLFFLQNPPDYEFVLK